MWGRNQLASTVSCSSEYLILQYLQELELGIIKLLTPSKLYHDEETVADNSSMLSERSILLSLQDRSEGLPARLRIA